MKNSMIAMGWAPSRRVTDMANNARSDNQMDGATGMCAAVFRYCPVATKFNAQTAAKLNDPEGSDAHGQTADPAKLMRAMPSKENLGSPSKRFDGGMGILVCV